MEAVVREYNPARDASDLRQCFIELHEFERGLEPALPPGESVAEAYLKEMLERCAPWEGKIFVAEASDRVIGFVCVWARVPPEDPAEEPSPYAFVSDLVVRSEHRGSGWGRRLLEEAERYARSKGIARIRVGVLARNRIARRLYSRSGFEDYHLQLQKRH